MESEASSITAVTFVNAEGDGESWLQGFARLITRVMIALLFAEESRYARSELVTHP